MRKFKTVDLVTIALVAAILCILAPVSFSIPFTIIPITLGLFTIVMAGIILGKTKGTICVMIYILLGAVGLPVFSGYIGGVQKIAGPTGGYIWGYLFLAWITGYFVERFAGKWYMCFLGAVLGTAVCYAFGTVWLAVQMKMGPMEALWAGVIPFIPFDLIKIVIAVAACCPVRSILVKQNLIRTAA